LQAARRKSPQSISILERLKYGEVGQEISKDSDEFIEESVPVLSAFFDEFFIARQ